MTNCPCQKCHKSIEPRQIGATVRWGHAETRRGGDKHPAVPPRWTEAELREAFGK
jgi:hypothetical protein